MEMFISFGMNFELLIADITEPKCQYLLKIKAKNQLKRIPLVSCAHTMHLNQMYIQCSKGCEIGLSAMFRKC